MNTQTLNIRINKNVKQQAQKIVEKLGLDLSSAVKLFLNKVIMTESIPFELNTIGRMNDPKFIKQLKKEVEQASKHGKSYNSMSALLQDLNG